MSDTPDETAAPKKKPVVLILVLANVLVGGGERPDESLSRNRWSNNLQTNFVRFCSD